MKNIIKIILLLNYSAASAHFVTLNIKNNSTVPIRPDFTSSYYNKGFLCNTITYYFPSGNTVIPVDERRFYTTIEPANACGVTGFFDLYSLGEDGKKYIIHISYENPFIGDNEFWYRADHPFTIKYIAGGEGSDMQLTFEISGGPAPAPPPPPIDLPKTGTKVIKGQFTWNTKETGEPSSGDLRVYYMGYLKNAFTVQVSAPAQLGRNKDGSGNVNFQGTTGYYINYEKLPDAKIIFTDSRDEEVDDRFARNINSPLTVIKFTISNLPENLPLYVSVNTKNANWNTGVNTPPKPPGKEDAKWMVFIHEKSKTENLIKFEVFGAWFNGDTGYSSDQVTSLLIQNLKKNLRQQMFHGTPADIKNGGLHKTGIDLLQQPVIKTDLKTNPVQTDTRKRNIKQINN